MEPSENVIALCAALERATSGWLTECCSAEEQGSPDYIATAAHDYGLFFARDCPEWLAKSETAGRVRVNREAVALIDAEAATECREFFTPEQQDHVRDAVIGLQTEGEPCSGDHECEAGLECNVSGFRSGERDVCLKPGTDRCSIATSTVDRVFADNAFGFHPKCAPGYECNGFPPYGTCDVSTDGCHGQSSCPTGSFCQRDGTCGSRASVPEGESCHVYSDCAVGTYCNRDDDTCHSKSSAGSPCADPAQCLGRCEDGVCVDWCSSG
ncbi:MAG: hypothetical protein AB7K71_31575 [Polyangiaceae bacterium]